MKVSRYNYAGQFPDGIEGVMADIQRMILNGCVVLSPEVESFERAFAQLHDARFGCGVNSGTDALAITLMALGLEAGDEVVTQANTFNATVTGIILAGGRPLLVDADEQTFLIDATQIESVLTPRTRALIPVHLYGKPTPMSTLLTIAARHALWVIEDAAQAHGARVCGRRVGSFGIAGCFSFHPSKNLAAAGDGGAIVTSDEAVAASIGEIRSLGQRGQNNHVRPGFNSKLDAVQACILHAKLAYLDRWNAERQRVARSYRERLADLPLTFQPESACQDHVYHLFQIRTTERDALLRRLVAAGIDAVIRYPQPIHLQPAFARFGWRPGQFPVAETLSRELLCLPIRPDLTDDQIDYVCDEVRRFFT